ncbi:MAG: DUF2236 domain-containing protein, partial [Myxococcales bacterium]|nr:DUF2236 domain-containing protein [Myxococcales bacterium]
MAGRRLAETGRYVIETIQVGGLRRDAEGFKIAVRVRMMHAMVRRMILASGRWNREAWGMPINQADMAGTILEFSLLFLWGARMMGFRFRPEESEAIMHLWRYSGYVSGVDAGLSCATEDEAFNVAHLADSILAPADEDSVALAQALRRVILHGAKTPLQKRMAPFLIRYHDGLTRAFNGDAVADALRIPNRWWKLAIVPTRAMVTPFEILRPYVPGGNRIASFLGNQILRIGVQTQLEGSEPDFHPGEKVHGEPRRRRFAREPAAV